MNLRQTQPNQKTKLIEVKMVLLVLNIHTLPSFTFVSFKPDQKSTKTQPKPNPTQTQSNPTKTKPKLNPNPTQSQPKRNPKQTKNKPKTNPITNPKTKP